jgi:lipid-binding SYLF domain-containing protein
MKEQTMKKKFAMFAVCLAGTSSLLAQTKEDRRLVESDGVLRSILGEDRGLPAPILQQSLCVAIFPGVKKVAVGIGASYGRGVLVCRKGAKMSESWAAPAMYSLDAGSLGVQLGSTVTDFVLAIVDEKAANDILDGKTKLGANATAAAGPTGAQANGYSPQAEVLTYSRSKGLFAGVSLAGATVDADKDANKKLYGKEIDAREIVTGETTPAAAQPLIGLLDKTSRARNSQ